MNINHPIVGYCWGMLNVYLNFNHPFYFRYLVLTTHVKTCYHTGEKLWNESP